MINGGDARILFAAIRADRICSKSFTARTVCTPLFHLIAPPLTGKTLHSIKYLNNPYGLAFAVHSRPPLIFGQQGDKSEPTTRRS